tara:strand:+ start:1287 stop:1436 length:150 start_codon:yes stop_codon:yes gene_type:complete
VSQSWWTVEKVTENKITKMSTASVVDFTFFKSSSFYENNFIEYISTFVE